MTEAELRKKIETIDKKLSKMHLPHGEGTIAWKNKETCYLQYRKTLSFPDNTSKRIIVLGHSIEEVREKMSERENALMESWKSSQIPAGLLKVDQILNDVILADAISQWFYKFNHLNKRGRTFDREECTLKSQILKNKEFANIQIGAITNVAIQDFLSELMKNYSYSTVKKTYELLDQFFRYYYSKNVNNNPMNTVVKPKKTDVNKVTIKTPREIRFFSPEEIHRFMHEATLKWSTGKPKYKFGEGLIFLMFTGLRFGEAVALTWADVDLDKRYVDIKVAASYEQERDENMQSIGRRIKKFDLPKTEAGTRKVYLISQAVEHLVALKELQNPQSDREYLFATGNNAPAVSYYNLHRAFNLICSNANITAVDESIGLHSLRHTFISMLCRNGVDKMVVANIVGQADTKMIEKIYYHIMQIEKDIAVRTLENIEEDKTLLPKEVILPEQIANLAINEEATITI